MHMATRKPLTHGIAEVEIGPDWIEDLQAVRTVLQEHFGHAPEGSRLVPSDRPDDLRDAVLACAPRLAVTAAALKEVITGTASALIIPRMHLKDLDVEDRGVLLYSLSLAMGYPTGTDPRQRQVVWPVTARAKSGAYFATYSEVDSEATYHTDAQYYPDPERYFLLYVVHAARCGGGESKLRSNEHIMQFLEASEEGRRALKVLQALNVPFRIPSVYTESGKAEERKYTLAPVIGEDGTLRWREDTVTKGLAERPEYDHPDLRAALHMLGRAFAEAPHEVRTTLGDDSLLLVDNHRTIHARTAFTDHNRHLLRIRFHDRRLVS